MVRIKGGVVIKLQGIVGPAAGRLGQQHDITELHHGKNHPGILGHDGTVLRLSPLLEDRCPELFGKLLKPSFIFVKCHGFNSA